MNRSGSNIFGKKLIRPHPTLRVDRKKIIMTKVPLLQIKYTQNSDFKKKFSDVKLIYLWKKHPKGTIMQIDKTQINDRYFVFQLFIILL